MTGAQQPLEEIVLYQAADGKTRIACRFVEETLFLSQMQMADLFQKNVRTINEYLQDIFAEDDLDPGATIRKFRIVRQEGERQVVCLISQKIKRRGDARFFKKIGQ